MCPSANMHGNVYTRAIIAVGGAIGQYQDYPSKCKAFSQTSM